MTLIAVAIAGTFPLLHLGRPWFFYWLVPYPSTMGTWPNFKSALPWDVAAISSYFLVSAVFFYLGIVPDLAAARDDLRGGRRRFYGTGMWLLVVHYLDVYWLIVPSIRQHWTGTDLIADAVVLLVVVALSTATARWRQPPARIDRTDDPLLTAALRYEAH